MKIELLTEVDSTNIFIKQYLSRGENTIVCAERQTGGRGTKGRSFVSKEGGVYLSALLFPDLPAEMGFRIMAHAAVSVCRTVNELGIQPSIKWPNDVLIGEKKCCGILIENFFKGTKIHASIIGIGLNVSNDVSMLDGIACTIGEQLSICPNATKVREMLIENLLKESTFEEYLSFVGFLGRKVQVIGKETYFATAKKILQNGELEVERDGNLFSLSSEEISIRFREET